MSKAPSLAIQAHERALAALEASYLVDAALEKKLAAIVLRRYAVVTERYFCSNEEVVAAVAQESVERLLAVLAPPAKASGEPIQTDVGKRRSS